MGTYLTSTFGYDSLDRLETIVHQETNGTPSTLFDVAYGYDPVGNRKFTRDIARTTLSELYVHDPRDRLRKMQRGTLSTGNDYIDTAIADGVHAWQQDWTLDARGNWSEANTQAAGVPDFKLEADPNAVNEYTQLKRTSGQDVSVTYPVHDDAGNLTSDPTAPNLTGNEGQTYEYDEENRLKAARNSSNALLLEIAYDALGRRVESRDHTAAVQCGFGPPVVTRHVMAGLHTLEEHIQCASSGSNAWTLAREFVWGDRFPEPVAMITHGGTSGGFGGSAVPSRTSVYYYLHDVLGSAIGLANAAGQLVERYTYDPYGKTRVFAGSGTTMVANSAYGNPFNWTGQRFDAASGLYHFLCRTYSPALGRWLQRDPLQYVDGVNLFEYVNDSPLRWIDRYGLDRYITIRNGHVYVGFDEYDKDGKKTGKIRWYDFAPPHWGNRGGKGGAKCLFLVFYSMLNSVEGAISGPDTARPPGLKSNQDWDWTKDSTQAEDDETIARIENQKKDPPRYQLNGNRFGGPWGWKGTNCLGWATCYFDDTPTERKAQPKPPAGPVPPFPPNSPPGGCFVAGTLVLTPDGFVGIECIIDA